MAREPLDDVEQKVLAFVEKSLRERGGGPTLQALADAFKWASTHAAGYRLEALEAKGYLQRPKGARGWQVVRIVPAEEPPVPRGRPVESPRWPPAVVPDRGRVSCGAGGFENDEEFPAEPLDVGKLFRRQDLVAYEATGTSMIEAHITPGDTLFVREDPDPPTGSLVVAMVDRDMVCKKLVKRTPNRVVLKPCNGEAKEFDFDPARIYFRILGVLHSVLRQY